MSEPSNPNGLVLAPSLQRLVDHAHRNPGKIPIVVEFLLPNRSRQLVDVFFASPDKKVSVLQQKIRERVGLRSSEAIFLHTEGEILNVSRPLSAYAPSVKLGEVPLLRVLASTTEIYG